MGACGPNEVQVIPALYLDHKAGLWIPRIPLYVIVNDEVETPSVRLKAISSSIFQRTDSANLCSVSEPQRLVKSMESSDGNVRLCVGICDFQEIQVIPVLYLNLKADTWTRQTPLYVIVMDEVENPLCNLTTISSGIFQRIDPDDPYPVVEPQSWPLNSANSSVCSW